MPVTEVRDGMPVEPDHVYVIPPDTNMAISTPIQIFATDVNDKAIEKARAAVYPESITADVSPERLRRFFIKSV
ncbi:MAG TPA: CheR family methyltransferase [Blastocatellia bacterium]|nr:CheR family methyltransferase [Blastocatellia bacterium]